MEPLSQLPYATGELKYVVPIVVPALFGLIALMADLVLRGRGKALLAMIGAAGAALTAVTALAVWTGDSTGVVMAGTLAISRYSAVLALGVVLATALISFATAQHGRSAAARSADEPPALTIAHGELYALMLFATSGGLALVVANDLVTFFVALEILSISVYCLTGLDRRRVGSAEGAMKYFVLGAFSSGFLLYGMSLLYGATHTMQLFPDGDGGLAIATAGFGQDAEQLPLALVGAVLLMVGLLFKVGAVPFHAWTPDAYEGAPTAVTGFMSVAVKVAAFGGALRVVVALGEGGILTPAAGWGLWLVAALTVILGNAGALTQREPSRLLAYSGIAHTGYLLIGILAVARYFDVTHPMSEGGAPNEVLTVTAKDAVAGLLFYLVGYGAANLAAFGVLCHLERDGEDVADISDLAGLAKTQPGAALAMTIAMISLAGIPCTAGFLGKLWVFRAGVAVGDVGLVVLALVTSVLSLYYYLRVVVVMYMQEPGQRLADDPIGPPARQVAPDPLRWASRLAFGAAAALTIVLGLYPTQALLQLIADGAEAIL